ncbi:MAG: gamma-glutamyltransferase family protein [Planctomycetota bacterium]|nr:gamma-glutamyltransferase family protein [Planctomycetota bacterium]
MAAPRALLAAAALLATGCSATDPFEEALDPVRPSAGAVVSEHPLATKAGLLVLEAGGNAADAAVAAALALAVVYPQAGNLGGGGFAVWVPRRGEPETIDFREVAPSRTDVARYLDEHGAVVGDRSLVTPLAVGVPGSPLGLYQLYTRHGSGRFSFLKLCEPAIRLAEEGFAVDAWLASTLRRKSIRELLSRDPGARRLFYPDGEALSEGDRLVQPALARTLGFLGLRGPRGFYEGPVAAALLADLKDADERAGSVAGETLMTAEDLEGYVAKVRPPLIGVFRGHEIIGMGPPSSGGVALLQVLGMLEGLPLDSARREVREQVSLGLLEAPRVGAMGLRATDGDDEPELEWAGLDARQLHWWIEAMRRAFADRAVHLGDPDHHQVPVEALLSPEWIAERRVSIGARADLEVAAWAEAPGVESSETTHLSVLDEEGNAVSLTTTLNGSFGSGIYVDKAGFLLNNELDDFSIQAGTPNMYGLVGAAANQLAPRKRPLSSMCPVVVRNERGDVALVLGAPGGPRIITAVTQVILRVLAYDQSLLDAVRAPRIHQQWRPEGTRFEGGWDPRILRDLEALYGQPVVDPTNAVFGSIQAIRVDVAGRVEAVSDPRRGGAAGLEGQEPGKPALPPR